MSESPDHSEQNEPMNAVPELRFLELQHFQLQSGVSIDLSLAYRCYGQLSDAKDNVIVIPTYYTGTDLSNTKVIGPEYALNPEKYFIVIPNLFGNSVSSSPSNTPAPFDGPRFPEISIYDNVKAQAVLLDSLGITNIKLVIGWSMGAVQSYQWSAQFPDRVERAMVICGSAKTAEHNKVFLKGVKSCIEADSNFNNGDYSEAPVAGLKAFARVYAGWAFSQAFYRNHRYKEMGFETAEDLLIFWEDDHLTWDANDLLAMLKTWLSADISQQDPYRGNLKQALNAIKATVWLVPCEQDLYFRYEDNLKELEALANAEYHGFESDFGHCAPGPGRFPDETKRVDALTQRLLDTDV